MKRIGIPFTIFLLSTTTHGQGWFVQQSGVTSRLSKVVFANARVGYVAGFGGVMLKTTNAGSTWSALVTGISNNLYSLTLKDSLTVWACGAGGAIVRTTDGGASWMPLNSGTTQTLRDISSIAVGSNAIVQTCGDNGVSLGSILGGATWFANTTNTTAHLNAILLDRLQNSSAIVAGAAGTLRYSTGGPFGSWPYPGSDEVTGMKGWIVPTPTTLYLCSANGTFTKGVASWTWTTVNTGASGALNAIDVLGNRIWVVGENGAVRHSTNQGADWNPQSVNSTVTLRSICMIDSATGWIVGDDGLIVSTRTGGVTSVHRQPSLSATFTLDQNYPNPFNPSTLIPFTVQGSGFMSLSVYDVLSRDVATLVNGNLNPGNHAVTFDGSGLASGIYIYRLTSGARSITRKLLLTK